MVLTRKAKKINTDTIVSKKLARSLLQFLMRFWSESVDIWSKYNYRGVTKEKFWCKPTGRFLIFSFLKFLSVKEKYDTVTKNTIIELTHSKTTLENSLKIKPQPAALDFDNPF